MYSYGPPHMAGQNRTTSSNIHTAASLCDCCHGDLSMPMFFSIVGECSRGRPEGSFVVFRSGQTNGNTIKTSDKLYLSLNMKGLCVRGSWRLNRTATYWPPHSIGHNHVSFPFSWAVQPGAWGPSLSETCSSIQHLISNWSDLQLIEFPVHWVIL